MEVISVQSHVSFGHVGNSAAVYPMQRLGVDVWPVHTALLAHHPGHGGFNGAMTSPQTLRTIFDGLRRLGAFEQCSALLSGYLGSVETGTVLIEAWQTIKAAAPDAIFCCAAVLGDREEGIYVDPALPAFFRDAALPMADVIVANAFEAGILSGMEVVDLETARLAAAAIADQGPQTVIISSVPYALNGTTHIGNLLNEAGGVWLTYAPLFSGPAKGAGDFMTAVWLAQYLNERDSVSALRFATGAVKSAVELSAEHPIRELAVIAASDQWHDGSSDVGLQKID
jgi:pyridoxine kinase